MKRRKFFKKIGKGMAGIAAAASMSAVVSEKSGNMIPSRGTVEIKPHPLAVPRKPEKNNSHDRRG